MLKFSGIVKGVKTLHRQNKDGSKKWDEFYVGISSPKTGGYDGELEIQDIRLSQKAIDDGSINVYTNLTDKRVEVPVFIVGNAWNDKCFLKWFLAGDSQPISVEGKPPALRKVS